MSKQFSSKKMVPHTNNEDYILILYIDTTCAYNIIYNIHHCSLPSPPDLSLTAPPPASGLNVPALAWWGTISLILCEETSSTAGFPQTKYDLLCQPGTIYVLKQRPHIWDMTYLWHPMTMLLIYILWLPPSPSSWEMTSILSHRNFHWVGQHISMFSLVKASHTISDCHR